MQNESLSKAGSSSVAGKHFLSMALLLVVLLLVFFARSFIPGQVLFSNDGPLGATAAAQNRAPSTLTGQWVDSNVLGSGGGPATPSFTYLLMTVAGPHGYLNLYPFFSLLLIGLCAFYAFRKLGLALGSSVLGGMAAVLVSEFFSTACWGVASQVIGFAMIFLAIGLVVDPNPRGKWIRMVLAGLAVGVNVIEAADIGALFSLLFASFVFVYSFVSAPSESPGGRRFGLAFGKVVLIAVFAAFIAANSVYFLVGTQIKGVVGTEQTQQSKAERWSWATQWSMPKKEALSMVVPGLFGYRMDTLGGGNYWGLIGSDLSWDTYLQEGRKGPAPQGFARFVGGGFYLGMPVFLIGLWALLRSLSRKDSLYIPLQKKLIWFWGLVSFVSLLLAFGRFAPFYQFLYALPYFSTIRNPVKFMHLLTFAVVVLFAYGVDGFWRLYFKGGPASQLPLVARVQSWWKNSHGFDKRWMIGCFAAFGAGLVGWLIYSSSRESLVQYLQTVQFDEAIAQEIAAFSIRQVGWFILFLLLSVVWILLAFSGVFGGKRARAGVVSLGLLLFLDLGRANMPWVVYWNFDLKYASNPIIDKLKEKPFTHRVAILPSWLHRMVQGPGQLQLLDQLYRIEWAQHHFLYYNIQSLDIVQMPRMPADLAAFEGALQPKSNADVPHATTRRWELTNTRFLLGPAEYVPLLLNAHLDPELKRFKIVERFNIVPKPGISEPRQLEELTAQPATNGMFAIIEFTGALPRAQLYNHWEVMTNQTALLERLASPEFKPEQEVLLSAPPPQITAAPAETNLPAGTVEFTSYSPRDIVLDVEAKTPGVLLLNDRYDPSWHVFVDGAQKELFKANFIMRGVAVSPGKHKVEFKFQPALGPFWVSVTAWGVAILLIIGLIVLNRKRLAAPPVDLAH